MFCDAVGETSPLRDMQSILAYPTRSPLRDAIAEHDRRRRCIRRTVACAANQTKAQRPLLTQDLGGIEPRRTPGWQHAGGEPEYQKLPFSESRTTTSAF